MTQIKTKKDPKPFIVAYVSRYAPTEGTRYRRIYALSKSDIRANWHDIINTDEYRIVKIEPAD